MILQENLWAMFLDFLDSGEKITILTFEITIFRLVAMVVSVVLIFLVFQIVKRIFYRIAKLNAFPAELYNGIMFILRLIFGLVLIWDILTFIKINSSYILILSGLVGTAIAFASVKTINNFVAGLWITLTTPYIIGDYVKIGDVEGIVVKITSFYTRIRSYRENPILIPNLTCLNSVILNFTIDIDSYRKKVQDLKTKNGDLKKQKSKKWKKSNEILLEELQNEIREKEIIIVDFDKYRKNLIENQDQLKNSKYLHRNKVIRYVFTLELPKRLQFVEENIQQSCQNWNEYYNFHIEGVLVNITSHFIYEFTLITLDPMDILRYCPEMNTDLYQSIYRKS